MSNLPLISCVMPTANRPDFVAKAITRFTAQDYPNKELVILDDGAVVYSGVLGENIRYHYNGPSKKAIPVKRNKLCDLAHGEVIAHFDDDDFSANNRLSYQVQFILQGASITGFNKILFYDDRYGKLYQYYHSPNYIVGATMMFMKDIWREKPFHEMFVIGSDDQFVADHQRYLKSVSGEDMFVAMQTKRSTHQRSFAGKSEYTELSLDRLPNEFKNYLKLPAGGAGMTPGIALESPIVSGQL